MEMSNGTTGSDIIVTTTATASPKYKGLLLQAGKKRKERSRPVDFSTTRHAIETTIYLAPAVKYSHWSLSNPSLMARKWRLTRRLPVVVIPFLCSPSSFLPSLGSDVDCGEKKEKRGRNSEASGASSIMSPIRRTEAIASRHRVE